VDNGNAGGGGAEGKILFVNTAGNAIGLGYTADVTTDSDFIISTNAGGTYGGYLGLASGAISDAQSDIILEPKTDVRIATGGLKVGTSQVITSSRGLENISAIQVGSTTSQNSFGVLQVNQATNNDESGIGILAAASGRSMRLWVDETTSYINSGDGGSADLVLNEAATISSNGTGTFYQLTLTGSTDDLTFTDSAGDWTINNAQQNNGITIFDGTGGVDINYNGTAVISADSNGIGLASATTVSGLLTASGGIAGLTLTNGISGNNFNITGVNQLEIADPGEGIVFTSGASGNITLAIIDDASDNILQLSGTGATFSTPTLTATDASIGGSSPGIVTSLNTNGDGKIYKSGSFAPNLYLTRSRAGDTDTTTNDYLGNIFFSGWRSGVTTEAYAAYISCKALSTVSSRQQGQLEFYTAPNNITYPTLSMYLNSVGMNIAGSLGVGTAPSGTTGEIRATNNITAYYSDERLKNLEKPIDNALEKVQQLTGYYFTENEKAKELGYHNSRRQVGVSAQEVEKVLPEVVTSAPINEDYKSVWYDKLVPLLIEAIKEQQSEIEQLKTMVNQLLEK